MKTIVRIFAYLLFVFGLLFFIATSSNKYTWMQDMDPSISTLPVDDGSGNRTIFTLLILIVIVATQLGIGFIAESKKEKAVSIVLVLLAISVWLSRYW